MKKRVIFSIYIEIPEALLDETGYSVNASANSHRTDRAGETKDKLKTYKNRLMWTQKWYADCCDADYKMYTYDKNFLEYYRYCRSIHDKLPMYHIVNYYKNHLLQELTKDYDEVFYMDIDIIPRSDENIFEKHDMRKIWAKNNNELAEWSKHYDLTKYNSCDRNPGIKYWNCYALLCENGYDPENDVINTGTVIGGKKAIQSMNWQGEFEGLISKLKELQENTETMFPKALHDRFAFDNETMFSYLVKTKKLKYDSLSDEWHGRLPDEGIDPSHKIIHAINKKFELIWDDISYNGRTL
jgi:hypothetical protein